MESGRCPAQSEKRRIEREGVLVATTLAFAKRENQSSLQITEEILVEISARHVRVCLCRVSIVWRLCNLTEP